MRKEFHEPWDRDSCSSLAWPYWLYSENAFFSVLFYLEFFSYYKLFEMKVIKQKSKVHDTGCKGYRSESGRRVKGEVWNIVI